MTQKMQIARSDFVGLLNKFKKLCNPSLGEEAVLHFSNSALFVELGGMGEECPASGFEEICLRIRGDKFMAFAKIPPRGDPVDLWVEGNKLRIGISIIACKKQELGDRKIDLPMDATTADILILKLQHSDKEIIESGHEKSVERAEMKCEKAIGKANQHLSEFHVTFEDLRKLINKCLLRESNQ